METGRPPIDRLLHAALSGLSLRQRVIADNIANVATPGFTAAQVSFEHVLREALGQGDGLALRPVAGGAPADLRPVVAPAPGGGRQDGNSVDVDREMIDLADTNLTYNALAQLTGSRMQLLRTVINDGRR